LAVPFHERTKFSAVSRVLAFCWSHVRRGFYDLAKEGAAPIATEALTRIAALYRIETDIRGLCPAERLAARQVRSRPVVSELRVWFEAQLAKLPARGPTAKAIRYALNHWDGLERFLDDGRIEIDSNSVERAMRPIATHQSLCTPSLSIWKHWKLIASNEVTRASFTPDRLRHGRCGEVGGEDLERRPGNDLLGTKDAGFDQLAYPVAGDAALLGCLSQGQPRSVLLGGFIGVNATDTPDRADPVCRPGLALSSRQAHPVEGRGDVLVRPAARHAANDGESVVGSAAFVFACARFTQAQFGVLSSLPMDDQDNLPSLLVDVDDDVVDEGSRQLLAGAHGDLGTLPSRHEVLGDASQLRYRRRRGASGGRVKTRLAVPDAA
jgi:hypothetical protein